MTLVRQHSMNGAETLKKAQEKKLAVEEIRMQRCKCGVTKLERVRHGTKGGTESGRNRKEISREGGGTGAGIYDEKRRPLPGKKVVEMEVQLSEAEKRKA